MAMTHGVIGKQQRRCTVTEESQQQETVETPEPVLTEAPKEVEEGKAFAILSYVLTFLSFPFFLVPLIMRNNAYSLYHSKQCLILWIAGLVLTAVSVPLMAVCVGAVLLPVGAIFLLVLNIMGIINAVNGRMEPLPVIGKWAEDWFKGITKVQA